MKRLFLVISLAVAPLSALPIAPLYYNMPNGVLGGFSYLDENYVCQGIVACTPNGNSSVSSAPLAGGKGDLTDGFIANQNWNITPNPYVGWATDPLLEFFFAPGTALSAVTISFDDSDGLGGVALPSSVTFGNGTNTLSINVAEASGSAPVSITFDISALGVGTYLSIIPTRKDFWVFISEVEVDGASGVPEPSSLLLLLSGILGAIGKGRLRSRPFRCLKRES